MKPPISKDGQAAKNRIAEVRQNVNNGMTGAQARSTVRYAQSPTKSNRKQALDKGVSESSLMKAPTTPAPTLNATATPQIASPTTITSASMTPTTPSTLADATPATKVQGMMSEFTDTTDTYTKNLEAQSKALEAPKQTAFQDYLGQLQSSRGLNQLTSEAYAQKGGVDEITPELNDINDKIRREQLSMRRQTEAVMQGGGQSKAQAQAQISNIERESFAKQADLAVIQMAVQGRYDSAKEIADRAVSAQLEQQTNNLAILKFNYEENKEAFTKAEQRAFEAAQADRENKLAQEREDKLAIKQFALSALQAGASTSEVQQAMGAKTLDEAISLVGGYFRPKPAAVGSSKPSITEIDGKPYVWDETTGQYVPAGEYIKGGGMDTAQQQQINDTIALARSLKRGDAVGKSSAVGASWAKFVPFGQSLGLQGDRTAFENKVNTLKANLTLDNLGLLKGPMSDKDLAFLQAVGSSLTTDMSEAEFDKELGKVITKLQGAKAPVTFQSNPTALPFGSQNLLQQSAQPLLAPDGTQVIITD